MQYLNAAILCISILIVVAAGCSAGDDGGLFERVDQKRSGIAFENSIVSTEQLNTYVFRNLYNGGGVAIGDVNNDGLSDILFTGNQVTNKLYVNRGDFRFEDVTIEAGLESGGSWTTGVSMIDVNGDGWLDIYICKSGPPGGARRRNELFVNNRDGTFKEMASDYGIDVMGLSIHASFFDYDRDGDLDLYLLSNPIRSLEHLEPVAGLRETPDPSGGNRFYRNEMITDVRDGAPGSSSLRNVGFIDITDRSGIYSSKIGFGLGVSVSDVNRDGWPDIYVSNDFFERDYLYLNNADGTFSEVLPQLMNDISLSSMGGDIADLNNDGYPEIFVSDMLPEAEARVKSKVSFTTWDEYSAQVASGYHHQFTRNSLQLNRGRMPGSAGVDTTAAGAPPVYFSEVGRMAGVEATDWSWGGLLADFDLDGYRDLFIPNGVYKDLLDQDFIRDMSDPDMLRSIVRSEKEPLLRIVDRIPSHPIANFMYAGEPGLRFSDVTAEWSLDEPSFSNGAAYGDLDNDGDLDLVINNVNMGAFVYENRSSELFPQRGWLQVDLAGSAPNTHAVGAQLSAWAGNRLWYNEQQPVRGFQSTVDHTLHFGFGNEVASGYLDSLVVRWPDGETSSLENVELNQRLRVRHPSASADSRVPMARTSMLTTELERRARPSTGGIFSAISH